MPYLTVEETAEVLRITVYAVRAMLRNGTLPGRRIGKRWLISSDELNALLRTPRIPA